MELVQSFFTLIETIMGYGLVLLILGGFISMFFKSGEDRYNGAGTLDS